MGSDYRFRCAGIRICLHSDHSDFEVSFLPRGVCSASLKMREAGASAVISLIKKKLGVRADFLSGK